MSEWNKVRKELARLARMKTMRINEWTKEMPCDWSPGTVTCPETDMPFTDAGAWNLIADLLDGDHCFREIRLRVPAGDIAYETTVVLRSDLPPVYIKIKLKGGRIRGRSFHNDLRKG